MMKRVLFYLDSLLDAERLAALNRFSAAGCAALTLLFLADIAFISPKRAWEKEQEAHLKGQTVKVSGNRQLQPTPETVKTHDSLESYLSKMGGKKLFGSIASEAKTVVESNVNNLALVGIIPGDNPQAILEDKTTQMTYYLTKGQTVSGITVEEIEPKKVTVSFRGETLTFTV